uniref:Uncharacterized protein n=1 Tax=Arundo donax TaxID=35708 RepID=A0A0A9DRF1_ARUDO
MESMDAESWHLCDACHGCPHSGMCLSLILIFLSIIAQYGGLASRIQIAFSSSQRSSNDIAASVYFSFS